MVSYLLELTFSWLLLYLAYQLFLQKEPYFFANRIYLLLSLVGGLLLPFLQIETSDDYLATLPVLLEEINIGASENFDSLTQYYFVNWSWQNVFITIYVSVVLLGFGRLFWGLYQIQKLCKNAEMLPQKNYTLVQTNQQHSPFSFGNYLFLGNDLNSDSKNYQYILRHEEAHIQQHHTFDILFVEILGIFFWFHPLVFLYKNALKDQHEYLADQAVLCHASTKEYGQLLIEQSICHSNMNLANHLIYSQLKKRINMMTKKHSLGLPYFKYATSLTVLMFVFWSVSAQKPKDEKVLTEADVMPYFKDCKNDDQAAATQCSMGKLMAFIGENLKYPTAAKEKKIEGLAVISFTVNKKGKVENVKIEKNPGEGCGEEAARIIKMMNDKNMVWVPGQKDGKDVAVQYNLPVRFRLS